MAEKEPHGTHGVADEAATIQSTPEQIRLDQQLTALGGVSADASAVMGLVQYVTGLGRTLAESSPLGLDLGKTESAKTAMINLVFFLATHGEEKRDDFSAEWEIYLQEQRLLQQEQNPDRMLLYLLGPGGGQTEPTDVASLYTQMQLGMYAILKEIDDETIVKILAETISAIRDITPTHIRNTFKMELFKKARKALNTAARACPPHISSNSTVKTASRLVLHIIEVLIYIDSADNTSK